MTHEIDITHLSPAECILLAEQLWEKARNHPEALPRVRAEVGGEVVPTVTDGVAVLRGTNGDARVFGGDVDGRRRARDFTGPEQAPG